MNTDFLAAKKHKGRKELLCGGIVGEGFRGDLAQGIGGLLADQGILIAERLNQGSLGKFNIILSGTEGRDDCLASVNIGAGEKTNDFCGALVCECLGVDLVQGGAGFRPDEKVGVGKGIAQGRRSNGRQGAVALQAGGAHGSPGGLAVCKLCLEDGDHSGRGRFRIPECSCRCLCYTRIGVQKHAYELLVSGLSVRAQVVQIVRGKAANSGVLVRERGKQIRDGVPTDLRQGESRVVFNGPEFGLSGKTGELRHDLFGLRTEQGKSPNRRFGKVFALKPPIARIPVEAERVHEVFQPVQSLALPRRTAGVVRPAEKLWNGIGADVAKCLRGWLRLLRINIFRRIDDLGIILYPSPQGSSLIREKAFVSNEGSQRGQCEGTDDQQDFPAQLHGARVADGLCEHNF